MQGTAAFSRAQEAKERSLGVTGNGFPGKGKGVTLDFVY